MTLTQVWGTLVIFLVCPLLGGLPLIQWMTRLGKGQPLSQLGTGNVSVSAAFYHGGRVMGILAVLSEAAKGIAAVLLARHFFPTDPAWEMIALISLVMGRYWFAQGAGTTNVFWGYLTHDPVAAGFVLIVSGLSFTILRERQLAKFGVLVIFPIITALRHPNDSELIIATVCLAGLLGWIYTKIPDDLALDPQAAQSESRAMLRFFRGDRAVHTLDHVLAADQFGQKAATLAELKRLGCPIPPGWVLVPGDDPYELLAELEPSPRSPVVVRSSAVGEDGETSSAAGQYTSIAGITSREALFPAISRCFASYDQPTAVQYRRSLNVPDRTMAVIVQQQIRGTFSGVAFSRDPVLRQGHAVVIEALPGNAAQVVSGQITPQTYRVEIGADVSLDRLPSVRWQLPEALTFPVDGDGDVPLDLVQQVAYLARWLEAYYHGLPQDIEWTFDGKQLWLLQSRPVTTLQPLWTRKIAAEVIPGLIRPLTWSINRPLTCGVWGEIFSLVLGDRAQGLDFEATATLHFSRAYFNATLLGQIFRRMGLPPESLEFLTRGTKFSKPPLLSTLRNLPGLLRLAKREWSLIGDFRRDRRQHFGPLLAGLTEASPDTLSASELLQRIDTLLQALQRATYYSILAPLSAALRKAIAKVDDADLDNRATPEISAVRSLQELAIAARQVISTDTSDSTPTDLWTTLASSPTGQEILARLDQITADYGYLSEVGTDIAVPTWQEDPQPVRELFAQFCLNPPPPPRPPHPTRHAQQVQRRFDLKGQVTEVYSRLLAELRWSFLAIEGQWLAAGWLHAAGDIFFLTFPEIRQIVEQGHPSIEPPLNTIVTFRKAQLERDRPLEPIPFLVYGNDPPEPMLTLRSAQATQRLQGIGASPGVVEGTLLVVTSLSSVNVPAIAPDTILVVPYTDSGWVTLLAQARGLIAEVGGRLSHGAIVAREYRIPAVMDLPHATQLLQTGQRVRLDGQQGIVEILE